MKNKRITFALGLLLVVTSIGYAQDPLPQEPGPVISISGGNGQTENIATTTNTSPTNPQPFPQGPGPVTALNGQSVNQQSAPVPLGPGPVVAESPNPNAQTPPPPPGWAGPGFLSTPPSANWMNQGTINVMGTGYDSQGVEKQIPMLVKYEFNGVNYNVVVINAWNPYTYSWDINVDQPAYQTSYFFNGFNYNYYTVLSTGTFYFNL